MPISVSGEQAVTLPDGRIAVLGGGTGCFFTTNCTIHADVNVYNPATNTWARSSDPGGLPAMTSPRYKFAAVLTKGVIYAIAGWNGTANTNSVERYDTANPGAGWQAVAPLTTTQPLESLAAAVGPDGRIYVAGGLTGPPDDSGGHPVNSVYIYDPSNPGAGWAVGPSLPVQDADLGVARFDATVGANGQVYVIGGFAGIPGRYDLHAGGSGWVVALDARTGRWTRATSLPSHMDGITVVPTANGQLFAIGGNPFTQVAIGTITEALGGSIPWHPHEGMRFSDGLSANVDLADGHVDVAASGLSIPARGPDLALNQVWDSQRAQNGDTTAAGQGWSSSLTPSMGGVLTQTVSFTDSAGTRWLFPYYGSTSGNGPFSQYDIPPGQPWTLSTSPITGYTLSNILTGEVMGFDAQGRVQATTDAYGNQNAVTPGTTHPLTETNSNANDHTTGRSLAFSYNAQGLLADAQSPLWQQRGASAAGSQHIAYGYNAQGQLTTLTRGAGTGDALTETFGYSGAELITVTTPYTQATRTWTLGYDPQGRLTSITSPVSGTSGQAGYTPSDITQFTYGVSQTTAIEGYGSSQPLTHTYTLDAQGNAPQTMDVSGQGHVRVAAYDVDHDVISGTDGLGNTTLYTYTYAGPTGSVGLLTQQQQPAISPAYFTAPKTPVVTTYSYDPTTNDRVEEDRPNGGVVRYTYDGHHAVASTTERTTQPCGPSCGVYTRRGTINQYDAYGELIKSTDGRGVDATGDGVAALDSTTAISYTGAYTYDAQGDQTSASTPPITTTLGVTTHANTPVVTTSTYDGDGNEVTSTSANGNTSMSSYDHLGRLVRAADPTVPLFDGSNVAPTTTTGYDGDGNVVSTQDASGATTTDSYDPLGRLVAETNPVSGTTIMTYTATRKAFDQDPGGALTAYRYNAGGQVNHVSDPVSGTVDYNYNAVGNVTAITTSDGTGTPGGVVAVETRGYDALNRVITDSVGGPSTITQTTRTAYDLDGNVAQVQQPNGDVVYDQYDLADQLIYLETDPAPVAGASNSTNTSYVYDLAGNQVEARDFDGRDHQTEYDADNRVTQATDTDPYGMPSDTTTTQYDPDGNVVGQTMQSGGQTSTYAATYNAADWLTRETRDGLVTGYGYDAAGRRRTHTVIDGQTPVTTTLDADGRATAIGENVAGTGPYTSTFGYDPNSNMVTATEPGGVGWTGGYDAASQLVSSAWAGPGGGPAAQTLASAYGYGYDALGRTQTVTTTVNSINNGAPTVQTLAHDALDRLTGAQGTDGTSRGWAYDGNGNVLTATITTTAGTTATIYGYGGAPNEVTTLTTSGQPTTSYGYDKNGDTTSITNTGPISTGLRYDSQARLSVVTLRDGTTVALGYNSAGQRSSYTVSKGGVVSVGETFTYREGQLAQAVVTGTATYTDTYVYDQRGAPLELLRQNKSQPVQRYWYEEDGRGNVVALTSITGTVVDRYGYDVWGAPIASQTTETVAQPLRYAGYWWDAALGWYWVTVRAYDPTLGRWLQPDPSGADGVRTYVYAGDDPIDATDPSGLQGGAVVGGAAAVCVGTIPIPFLGEVDCATAIAIAGIVFVVGYLATHTHAAPVPQIGTVKRKNQGTSAIRIQFQVARGPAIGAETISTEAEVATAPDTNPGVTKAQGLAALNAAYAKQSQSTQGFSGDRYMPTWNRLRDIVASKIARSSYIVCTGRGINALQGGPEKAGRYYLRIDVDCLRGGAFGV